MVLRPACPRTSLDNPNVFFGLDNDRGMHGTIGRTFAFAADTDSTAASGNISAPKIWDETALAGWALPVAGIS